jgi:hypothetical protein
MLTTDGRFVDLASTHLEADDTVEQAGEGRVNFELHTYSDLDGLAWSIEGGSRLTLRLYVDGLPAPPQSIHIGRNNVNPEGSRLTIWR